ncbi:hypothetical protein FZC76_00945 [Sutcliffiella horikoshii]|uniref:DUF4830 domain-containing protein n=1 Tax=Sutcliffiella horikoshii TaxID=79883 RepID=A0A5D4T591_9BACI|nr:hypothetical protein [Sutcliffiella horikoshii]TYS70495.1 hypothetical protein FZC76_00945 [Sutcliffiella horikoshii]
MKTKVCLLLFFSLVVLVLGIRWIHLSNLSESSTTALSYLQDKGLFVLYHEGDFGPYTTTKNVNEKPYNNYLSVQQHDQEFFMDKELHHEFFYVSTHPLSDVKIGRILITVMMNDEEVIGAFSVKNGNVYSLLGEEK